MKRIITLIALLSLFATGLQAQIIDATNNSTHKQEKTSNNSSIYKPTGHYLRLETGFPQIVSVAYGYQINPNLMVGIGGGFGNCSAFAMDTLQSTCPYYDFVWGLPIYAEALISTPKLKWSLFVDIKTGYNITSKYGFYDLDIDNDYYDIRVRRFFGAVNVGLAYKNLSIGAGVSSNNPDWWSFSLSYNLPLMIH